MTNSLIIIINRNKMDIRIVNAFMLTKNRTTFSWLTSFHVHIFVSHLITRHKILSIKPKAKNRVADMQLSNAKGMN